MLEKYQSLEELLESEEFENDYNSYKNVNDDYYSCKETLEDTGRYPS